MFGQRGRINNKEKQAAGGNWGHPRKFLKRHTKIDDPLIPEKGVLPKSKKKKKKIKKEWKLYWEHCPFCDAYLPEIQDTEEKEEGRWYRVFPERVHECPSCHAIAVKECPACKRDTWFLNGFYKHQGSGCGFWGTKKETQYGK